MRCSEIRNAHNKTMKNIYCSVHRRLSRRNVGRHSYKPWALCNLNVRKTSLWKGILLDSRCGTLNLNYFVVTRTLKATVRCRGFWYVLNPSTKFFYEVRKKLTSQKLSEWSWTDRIWYKIEKSARRKLKQK